MFTFSEAVELAGTRKSKKIGNNTYVEVISDDCVGIRLHNTYVVKMYSDGSYRINCGGYATATTKDRINKYAPVKIVQRKGIWYVGKVPFVSGTRFNRNGVQLD